jgi:hypothetical protein
MVYRIPTAYRPYWHGLENGERLERPMGLPGPAIETTFDGVRYILTEDAQRQAVYLVNRRMFRHGEHGRRGHARATLALARILGVNTYLAGLIADWVAPDHCGIGWQTGRIRILSREEEHTWRTDLLIRKHNAEIAANYGICDVWAHRNNRVCPSPENIARWTAEA